MIKRLVVAISGASGVTLGLKFIRHLPPTIEKHIVLSESAEVVIEKEHNIFTYPDNKIEASVSSGSFGVDATVIIPCSMNTLAKVAHGINDNLTSRVAAVAIKERKPLLLAPRELPFSPIALENMLKLANIGVIIAPPVLGYYADTDSLEKMEDFIIGKWFDQLAIPHDLYQRWEG
jgi:4-hydroxy-3-polyprenylbenzoate decarboxylase